MTDDFSSETKRTTDSRTTFVKQRKKEKKSIKLSSISSENIFQFEELTLSVTIVLDVLSFCRAEQDLVMWEQVIAFE